MSVEPHINGVPLREYVEARMLEQERGREIAAAEREKAAQELRDTQYRAMEQAEREREKAASAMRESLARSISEGDERLREHIANQIQQINGALESAEKLEIQRMAAAKDGTQALRREMQLITEAAQNAVLKAEDAQKEVNAKSNEFRGQLSDQAANLMPRKESEARSVELDRRIEEARTERGHQIDALNARLILLERGETGYRESSQIEQRYQDRKSVTIGQMIAVVAVIVTVVGVLAAILIGAFT